jgi:hypothetical protein
VAVFLQEGSMMVFTGKETAEKPDQHVMICPMEVSDFMELIKTGRQLTFSGELEQIGAETARVWATWAQYGNLRLDSHEEALPSQPTTVKWIQLAQITTLGSHPYILEDDPELPKESRRHVEEGGEILEEMCAGAAHHWNSRGYGRVQAWQEAWIAFQGHH